MEKFKTLDNNIFVKLGIVGTLLPYLPEYDIWRYCMNLLCKESHNFWITHESIFQKLRNTYNISDPGLLMMLWAEFGMLRILFAINKLILDIGQKVDEFNENFHISLQISKTEKSLKFLKHLKNYGIPSGSSISINIDNSIDEDWNDDELWIEIKVGNLKK